MGQCNAPGPDSQAAIRPQVTSRGATRLRHSTAPPRPTCRLENYKYNQPQDTVPARLAIVPRSASNQDCTDRPSPNSNPISISISRSRFQISTHHLHQPTNPSQTWPALPVPSSSSSSPSSVSNPLAQLRQELKDSFADHHSSPSRRRRPRRGLRSRCPDQHLPHPARVCPTHQLHLPNQTTDSAAPQLTQTQQTDTSQATSTPSIFSTSTTAAPTARPRSARRESTRSACRTLGTTATRRAATAPSTTRPHPTPRSFSASMPLRLPAGEDLYQPAGLAQRPAKHRSRKPMAAL